MTGVLDHVALEADLIWREFVDWVPDSEVMTVAKRNQD